MVTQISPPETVYFTVATAGHVDHGKTSVLRALTGIDPDRLKEEKARQMTTDLGFAHLRIAGDSVGKAMTVGFIDVPGHGKFLKNMLAGVGGIDIAMLIVAADEGPMPQTVQHVKILSLLGVKKALVVLTKIDIADGARQDAVIIKIEDLLRRWGVEMLDLVRVSCTQIKGFDDLKSTLGKRLQDVAYRGTQIAATLPAFLPIDRVFSKSGYGVVVTGTLVRGQISQGDNVFIEPGGIAARVRGLETFNQHITVAKAGQRLAVNLALKENKPVARGQGILNAKLAPTDTLIVEAEQFELSGEAKSETELAGQPIRLYHGTAECLGKLRWLEPGINEAGRKNFIVQIGLQDPLVAEPGDRFVIRYLDEGIAGGAILITSRPRWLNRAKLIQLSRLLLARNFKDAIPFFVDCAPYHVLTAAQLYCFLPLLERTPLIDELINAGKLVKLGEYLTTAEAKTAACRKLLDEVEKKPQSSAEGLRAALMPGLDRSAFQHFVAELVQNNQLVRHGDKLSLPTAQGSKVDDAVVALSEKVSEILTENKCLELTELVRLTGSNAKQISAAVSLLSESGKASLVNYEYASLNSTLADCHQILGRLWQTKKDISPSDFKEELGVTRKYAMALLAHFDDQKITRRLSTGRVLLKAPK